MQYNGPNFQVSPTVQERCYPAGVIVEASLQVRAISRWRGPVQLNCGFLGAGYGHLPQGSSMMFHLDEIRDPARVTLIVHVARFSNPFDAFHLLGQIYWCSCEFIAFTTYNIFPARDNMHTLPYNFDEE
jgi:hypothetical protein